jgi:hypothetical protein
MLRWLQSIVLEARARKAAVALIRPAVEDLRARRGGISDAIWLEPYMVGFMSMLITIFARWEAPSTDDAALGRIQERAWQEITGLRYPIGREILLLSQAQDEQFATGCRDAATVVREDFQHGVYVAATRSAEARWKVVFEDYFAR